MVLYLKKIKEKNNIKMATNIIYAHNNKMFYEKMLPRWCQIARQKMQIKKTLSVNCSLFEKYFGVCVHCAVMYMANVNRETINTLWGP